MSQWMTKHFLAIAVLFSLPLLTQAALALSDQDIYIKVLENYRKNRQFDLSISVENLLKNHPNSVHADNALYLKGLSALGSFNYELALKSFTKLEKLYPNGNKMPAALLAKGIAYRKLGDKKKARESFARVRKLYPESPEYRQAEFHTRLLEFKD